MFPLLAASCPSQVRGDGGSRGYWEATAQRICGSQDRMAQTLDSLINVTSLCPFPAPTPHIKGIALLGFLLEAYSEMMLAKSLAGWLALRKCSAFVLVRQAERTWGWALEKEILPAEGSTWREPVGCPSPSARAMIIPADVCWGLCMCQAHFLSTLFKHFKSWLGFYLGRSASQIWLFNHWPKRGDISFKAPPNLGSLE